MIPSSASIHFYLYPHLYLWLSILSSTATEFSDVADAAQLQFNTLPSVHVQHYPQPYSSSPSANNRLALVLVLVFPFRQAPSVLLACTRTTGGLEHNLLISLRLSDTKYGITSFVLTSRFSGFISVHRGPINLRTISTFEWEIPLMPFALYPAPMHTGHDNHFTFNASSIRTI